MQLQKKILETHGYWHSIVVEGVSSSGRGLLLRALLLLLPWSLESWHLLFFFSLIDCRHEDLEKVPLLPKWTPSQVTCGGGGGHEKQALFSLPPSVSSTCPLRSLPISNIHSPFVNPWAFQSKQTSSQRKKCFQAVYLNT